MSYTINETNQERQWLLAKVLHAPTIEVLSRVKKIPGGRCLDLGCGQGNTTRMLAEFFEPSECIGFDFDQALVDYASAHELNTDCVRFEQGNAMQLPYEDASFDVVFTRYLLVHMPDPAAVVREMLRVVKPGGKVVAYEPDMSNEYSFPDSWGVRRMTPLWNGLFASPNMGRRLASTFREAGAKVETGTIVLNEMEPGDLRKVYRLSLEAIRQPVLERSLATEDEFEAHLEEMKRLEVDGDSILFKFPDMWVVASC